VVSGTRPSTFIAWTRPLQRLQRLRQVRVGRGTFEIGEEHVVAEAPDAPRHATRSGSG